MAVRVVRGGAGTSSARGVGRRGLWRGVIALGAMVAAAGRGTAQATQGQAILAGVADQTATGTTELEAQSDFIGKPVLFVRNGGSEAPSALAPAIHGSASIAFSSGVLGSVTTTGSAGVSGIAAGTGFGVFGRSESGIGVYGKSDKSTAILGEGGNDGANGFPGVVGRGGGTQGAGVVGLLPGATTPGANVNAAVYGDGGTTGFGAFGSVNTSGAAGRAGVTGRNQGSGPGVRGFTVPGTGVGVVGESGSNFGVYGQSSTGVGIRGVSFSTTAAGIEGVASGLGPGVWGFSSSGHAILGNSATGNGGVFAGKTGVTTTGSPNALVANGNVTCTGTGHFNGGIVVATRSADGSLQATYGITSPEAIVEDFGRARLVGGVARVELDQRFVRLLANSDYDVFPVPNGDCRGIYIANRAATTFEIRELGGGTATVDVSYRVVGRRGGAQAGARFADGGPTSKG